VEQVDQLVGGDRRRTRRRDAGRSLRRDAGRLRRTVTDHVGGVLEDADPLTELVADVRLEVERRVLSSSSETLISVAAL
jgi:hypothetical protein